MFSRKKPASQSLVKPGREGEKERVIALEDQLQTLSNTAVKAVDRATELEDEIAKLKSELCARESKISQLESSIPSKGSAKRMPVSASISSIRSTISDKSSDSFNSLFSDMTTSTFLSLDGQQPLSSEEHDPELVRSLQQKLEESHLENKRLQVALENEVYQRVSLEQKLAQLQKELKHSKGTKEREGRLLTLERSIRSINSARDALNRPGLHKYI